MHRAVLAVAILSACRADDPFICDTDAQCRRAGLTGKCEASSNCSFPDGDCPTGRRYVNLASQSGQCVLDDDHDMIADDGDNCVGLANPGQDDEDDDGRGDPCDPCPPFSDNAMGAGDDDGDGVGNLCDPNPTAANKIVFFEGFHTALPISWSVTGSPVIENDGLTLQNASDATLPVPSPATGMLLVGVVLKQTPATGAWLGLPYQPGVNGAYCELTTARLELWEIAAPNRRVDGAMFTASLDKEYVYSLKRTDPTQFACSVSASASAGFEVKGTANPGAATALHIGADVTTHFNWVLVVGSP